MSTELMKQAPMWDADQIDLVKKTIAKGASDNELKLFMHVCQKTGLDPFARQIYATFRNEKNKETNSFETKMTIQISIDGFRLVAQRSGKYAGQDGPYWCGLDGVWKDIWVSEKMPYAAKVGVYHKDFEKPLYAVAKFDSYAATFKDGNLMPMWKKMPEIMIAKCAESLALRKAFPQELSGLYTSEEMSQAENEAVAHKRQDAIDVVPSEKPMEKIVSLLAGEPPTSDTPTGGEIKELVEVAKLKQWQLSDIKEVIGIAFGIQQTEKLSASAQLSRVQFNALKRMVTEHTPLETFNRFIEETKKRIEQEQGVAK